ncbi:MAG TPA: MXAN_5187 family protein [Polyangiales bacterium]|nr:MXAN_5187 family protein [Polyangiales bacterium]
MLSRLWYLVLALAVGGALAGAFLNKSAASREAEFQLEEQLRRDRIEAELWMRLDARLRLDALATIAVEPEVRQTLRSSSGRAGTPGTAVRNRLSQKLNELNTKLEEGKGDLVFALDTEGEVVATLDKNAMGSEQLDKMPLVQDALRGFMRDDVWVYNGEVYRMAARPVFDGGRYVGAVVHGMLIRDELAKRLGSKLPNASLVFFFRDRLIASHVGGANAPSSAELKNGMAAALAEMAASEGSVEVSERTRLIGSSIRGGAAHAQVGYIIGRRGSTVGLGGLFANTFQEDVASLPWPVVVGIPLLLLLLGLFLLYLEHDKAVKILRKTSESLAKSELGSLPEGELRRHYRKIAENLNVALRAGVGFKEDASKRAAVDLDQILSNTRDSTDTGYFGFGAEAPTAKQVSLDSEPELEVKPAASGTKDALPTAPPNGTPTARPNGASKARPQRSPSSRPKRAPSSWPARAPSSRHQAVATIRHSEDNLTPAPDDPPTRPNAILDDYAGFDEPEENTQVKHVPQELIEASAPAVQGEETHFREVFEQFVAMQKECGAPVSGLTFDKFVRKLHAARDQIMKRHNAPAVHFTVYVKEGRAALKASPVKQ